MADVSGAKRTSPRAVLNLGILAHVDAGKTSLTERLLYEHGEIRRLGSVDAGTTTTDSDELERERGITIRSTVASFMVGDLLVNLVDTPGHPDFIAEVERALAVLDGVILVLSAVEGVQAQTKILMRTLQKLHMPVILFVNKIDRLGARTDDLLDIIKKRLAGNIIPMNRIERAGTRDASVVDDIMEGHQFESALSDLIIQNDDALLERFATDREIGTDDLMASLAEQTRTTTLYPVFFGSAVVGVGIEPLVAGIRSFLPFTEIGASNDLPLEGTVFAIDRSYVGDKIAYIRLFQGMLRERQRLVYTQQGVKGQIEVHEEAISSLECVGTSNGAGRETLEKRNALIAVSAGNIAKVRGLAAVRVGARLGGTDTYRSTRLFRPPGLEAIVHARSENGKAKLYSSIMQMSDEDPLIQARLTEDGGLSIQLYGEVQKEVIRDRLNRQYKVDPVFSETQVVYFERPIGVGYAEWEYDTINVRDNNFPITIGLRVEPNKVGAGNRFVREAKWGLMPSGFYRLIQEGALKTLSQGLYGWEVTDCVVTLTKVGYERPLAVAGHFRYLTAIILMRALRSARSLVYEPHSVFELEVPILVHGSVIDYLTARDAKISHSESLGEDVWCIYGSLPTRLVQDVTQAIPGLTNGEGALSAFPASDELVRCDSPCRERTDGNPLDFENYMKYLEKYKLL